MLVKKTRRQLGSALAMLVIAALAHSPAAAVAAPCIGSGASECPYQGLALLDERPKRSPYAPTSVAVNPTTHDIYLSDRFANAIKQYSQDGTFLRSWGGRDTFGGIDDLDLAAEDRLNAGFFCRFVEGDGAEHVAVVGDGDRLHFRGGDPLDEVLHLHCAVQHRVLRMDVKVRELGLGHHPFGTTKRRTRACSGTPRRVVFLVPRPTFSEIIWEASA